jgi:hypothetical protein
LPTALLCVSSFRGGPPARGLGRSISDAGELVPK